MFVYTSYTCITFHLDYEFAKTAYIVRVNWIY